VNKKTDKFLNRYKTISDKWCKMNKKLAGTIIAVVLIGVLMAGCVDESAPDKTPTPKPAATPEPIQTPKPTVAPTPAVKPPAQMTTGCDMCHKTESTAELQAHVKGAQSCMGSEIGDCHSGEKYGGADANVCIQSILHRRLDVQAVMARYQQSLRMDRKVRLVSSATDCRIHWIHLKDVSWKSTWKEAGTARFATLERFHRYTGCNKTALFFLFSPPLYFFIVYDVQVLP